MAKEYLVTVRLAGRLRDPTEKARQTEKARLEYFGRRSSGDFWRGQGEGDLSHSSLNTDFQGYLISI